MPYQSINPAIGNVLKTFKEHTAAQLEKALRIAVNCYTTWRQTSFSQRVDEFARPMTLEIPLRHRHGVAQAKEHLTLTSITRGNP